MKSTIRFTLKDTSQTLLVETNADEYRNLMVLIKDKLCIEGFGECGGMGRCATCTVTATGLSGQALSKERNEAATLEKINRNTGKIRLSCQIYITKDLEGTFIQIE